MDHSGLPYIRTLINFLIPLDYSLCGFQVNCAEIYIQIISQRGGTGNKCQSFSKCDFSFPSLLTDSLTGYRIPGLKLFELIC